MRGQQLQLSPPKVVRVEVGRRSAWLYGADVSAALELTEVDR